MWLNYARIHEKGGTINHSNLFGRGIKATINMPARPYLEPAAEDSKDWIINHLKMQMEKVITKAEV